MEFTKRETALILAALRLLQRIHDVINEPRVRIQVRALDGVAYAFDTEEVDALAERINCS